MKHTTPSTILVIIGITGDLSRRKLLPAIVEMSHANVLPDDFHIVGISRRSMTAAELLDQTPAITEAADQAFMSDHLTMHQMELDAAEDYHALRTFLNTLREESQRQTLFYLSVPPQVSQPIVRHMGEAGFGELADTKLLLEKPFGSDLASAEELVVHTKQYFSEAQLYRIDHYLAKEMAQNIIVFRSGNSLFRHTWNNQFIEKIEVVASETIGIEGRTAFYEQTGALRDVVQSHLLQLAALTLMDLPDSDGWAQVPALRLAALKSLQAPHDDQLPHCALRGQYASYAAETGNPGTLTETFVSLTLTSTAPQWQGVPIVLTTGKSLDKKTTEIRIHYKKTAQEEANTVTLRIQPNEGIEVVMWAKQPGFRHELVQVPLSFTYADHYPQLPEAYERVLADAMQSDHRLFPTSDEVVASWRVLAAVQHYWNMHDSDLHSYPDNSSAEAIIRAIQNTP